jgi:alkaline phosphatase
VANTARDSDVETADNAAVDGKHIPGFLVPGVIENGVTGCPPDVTCPADTASYPHPIAGHTATDVPLSATGPGAWQFTGLFENTDVFLKMLRAGSGTYPAPGKR